MRDGLARNGVTAAEFTTDRTAMLEVIWNGSHGNADGDLLCCPKIPQKRILFDPFPEAEPVTCGQRMPESVSNEAYALVRASLMTQPYTLEELRHATGLSTRAIQTAMQRIRRNMPKALVTTKIRQRGRSGSPFFVQHSLRRA
jgi:hypothetical protein